MKRVMGLVLVLAALITCGLVKASFAADAVLPGDTSITVQTPDDDVHDWFVDHTVVVLVDGELTTLDVLHCRFHDGEVKVVVDDGSFAEDDSRILYEELNHGEPVEEVPDIGTTYQVCSAGRGC